MVSYYDIPSIVTEKAGIDNEREFETLITKECGSDEEKQYVFMCKWIKEWLQKNKLRQVLAEICDEHEMAELMNFVAEYIDAFDYDDQDMICDHAYMMMCEEIEDAEQRMIEARHNQKNDEL